MKQVTDTAGNQLRQVNGQWQILQAGIGWREFVGKTYIIDVGMVDTTTPEHDEETEESQVQASIENDLFIHFAGLAMQGLLVNAGRNGVSHDDCPSESCNLAYMMIDELKERGKL